MTWFLCCLTEFTVGVFRFAEVPPVRQINCCLAEQSLPLGEGAPVRTLGRMRVSLAPKIRTMAVE